MTFSIWRSARTAVVSALVAGLLLGCGSDEESSISTGGLEGEPIKLGSILTITNPAWNNAMMEDVNNAFASYINEELGGIDGRPLVVESCDDHGDPAKTTQCLNNLIDSGVVGFVNNSSLAFGDNALPAMEKAGLANMGGWPVTSAEYASDHEFLTSPGATGSYPSLAVFMRGQGAESLAMMYSNTPSGQAVSDQIEALWESLGGSEYTGVEFDPAAPDFTPPVSEVADAEPDAVILAVGEGAAPRLFQALQIADIDADFGATAAAGGEAVQSTAGEAMEGMLFSLAAVPPDHEREDAETYREVMEQYAPDTELSNQAAVAASGMMFAYDALSSIEGEITKQSLLETVQSTDTWQGFLVHGYDRSIAPPELPAVGNPWNLVTEYSDEDFTPMSVEASGEVADYVKVEGDLTWIAGSPQGS